MAKIRRDMPDAPVPSRTEPASAPEPERDGEPHQKPYRRKPIKKKRNRGGWLNNLLIAVFALVFAVSGGMLAVRLIQDRAAEDEFASVKQLIDTSAETGTDSADSGTQAQPESNHAKFARLQEQNADFIGWLSIDGTNLDYPVMYHPSAKDYYLRRNFNEEYSRYGTPYLDEKCSLEPRSENWIIYGHNMKTGTIFGCLTEYQKDSYWVEHPTIRLDTIFGDGEYQVYAAFAIDVINDTSFLYNEYTSMDEETFNEYVAQCKSRSAVYSSITPVYGDALLTLSTCEYSSANGRFVVCAVKTE